MTTILQDFLNSHLMDVDPNDEEFDKLKKAATSLSKSEFGKKKKVIRYTLVGIDPRIPSSEPLLQKAKNKIEDQSPTILSKTKDLPITTIRAVILEALYTRASHDIEYARIVWYTASEIIAFYNLGNEKEILSKFLKNIGQLVEKEALKKWSFSSPDNDIAGLKLQFKSLKRLNSKIASFKEAFNDSVTYQGLDGSNPGYPHQNNRNWTNHFAEEGSNSIANLVRDIVKAQKNDLDKLGDEIEQYLKKASDKNGAIQAIYNRNQLMWWKESLYSNLMKCSYRDLESEVIPLVMAYDLYSLVDSIYPVSIDYFLKETINSVNAEEKKVSLDQFIEKTEKNVSLLPRALSNKSIPNGRITLLHYLIALNQGEISNRNKLENRIGIKKSKEVPISTLAVWLFHDLQSFRTSKV